MTAGFYGRGSNILKRKSTKVRGKLSGAQKSESALQRTLQQYN